MAFEYGHAITVQLLLNYGADITFCDENGYNSIDIACQNGNYIIVILLQNNGADIT